VDTVIAREPHLVAVLEGDDRYQRALEVVEAARTELELYRAEIKVSDVGVEQWKRDVSIRQAALDLARQELRSITPTRPLYSGKLVSNTREDVEAAMGRDANGRLVARVVVRPIGRGRRVHPARRAEVWLVGAEAPLDLTAITPVGDPETIAMLTSAHTT
jgi:hypothetical protein